MTRKSKSYALLTPGSNSIIGQPGRESNFAFVSACKITAAGDHGSAILPP
jgi:hypothetical protein